MGFLQIDENRCKKDGLCIQDCPMNIIYFQNGDGYPVIAPADENMCSRCGHCVVVCPHGALVHAKVPMDSCPPVRKVLNINEEQAAQFLRSRRSIRLYKEQQVETEKITKLIEIARYAPSGGNSQSVEWLVIKDKSAIGRIAGMTANWIRQALKENPQLAVATAYLPAIVRAWDKGIDSILRNAPVVVVASAPGRTTNGMVDLNLALSYLELYAPLLGLGTCWAGLLQRALLSSPSLKRQVGIPEDHPYHYPMMLGYPKVKYYRLPARKPPKITFK